MRAREPRRVGVRPHGHAQRLAQAQHARPVAPGCVTAMTSCRARLSRSIVRARTRAGRARCRHRPSRAAPPRGCRLQQALRRPCLHGQQELGALRALRCVVRHERMRRHRAAPSGERGAAAGKTSRRARRSIGHKVVLRRRSAERQQVELRHEQTGLGRKRRVLGRTVPFSAMRWCAEKTARFGRFVRPRRWRRHSRRDRARTRRAAACGGGRAAGRLGRGRAVGDHGRPGGTAAPTAAPAPPHPHTAHTEAKCRHLRAAKHQPAPNGTSSRRWSRSRGRCPLPRT